MRPAAAAPCADGEQQALRRHVGYYLLGRGRPDLEKRIGYRSARAEAVRQCISRRATGCYFGGVLGVWLLALGATVLGWHGPGYGGLAASLLLLGLLAAGGVAHFAVTVANWLCSLLVAPQPVVRLDFSSGIPVDHRTLVVIPTMLTGARPFVASPSA